MASEENELSSNEGLFKDCNWYAGLKDVFDVVEVVDVKNVKVACKKCLPAKVTLSSSKTSAANLLKHIQVWGNIYGQA